MVKSKTKVVIGLLGPTLDYAPKEKRWDKWRPTVSIFQHDDFLVDRIDLLFQERYQRLYNIITNDIKSISPESKINPVRVEFDDPWDFQEVYGVLHDFAKGYKFNPDKEEYYIHISTGTHVAQICLFLLTEAKYFPAKLLQTSPPSKKLPADLPLYSVIDLDLSKYDKLASRFHKERVESLAFLKSGIETKNKQFNQLMERIEHVAINSHDPILLSGPTGAGKTHLARRIYQLKKIRHQIEGEFVEVNCATLRGDLASSTLFGHVKGAFTGALQARPGLLITANKGMLFLDEIGELGLDEQAMLLRALEEKRFMPLGADKEVESDFQLIAGTNRNLEEQVEKCKFREDLLARINLWCFYMPGLKDRTEDIEPNLEYELDKYAAQNDRILSFNSEARKRFLSFAKTEAKWQANFRDFNAAIIRMGTLASGGRIKLKEVEEEITRLSCSWKSKDSQHSLLDSFFDKSALDKMDLFAKIQLSGVLDVCLSSASLSEAGRKLFAASRSQKRKVNDADRLKKFLAKFNIDWRAINNYK